MNELKLREVVGKYGAKVENLLPILMAVQETTPHQCISTESAKWIADEVGIPYSQMSEVLSFFAAINNSKKGKYHIELCNSTVCRVNDGHLIEAYLKETLGIDIGETTEDQLFSLDYAPCFGACDISPSIRINKKAYGHLTVDKVELILKKLEVGHG